jgi:GTP pyrophosphokinase
MVGGLAEQLRNDAESDQRVYVFTPEGHVVDMMAGATPLDFAYYVHTEVGNHCSGARVNDKLVPLNYQLKTGDRVEVISSELNVPSRDWLKPHLGFAQTPRAQAKIQQWFKSQDREQNHEFGQMWLETEFHRAGLVNIPFEEVARKLGCRNGEGLFVSVGTGTITVPEVVEVASQLLSQQVDDSAVKTDGSVLPNDEPVARTVEILIKSQDRAGLLRDITTILANESIYVLSIATHSDRVNGTAELKMQIELTSWTHLLSALGKLNDMESIIEARRTEGGV